MSPEQKNPAELREEIDENREQLGDTVEALAGKADVKGQAKAKIDSAKQSAQQKAEELASKAKEVAPDSAGAGAQQMAGIAQENPVPLAIAGAFVAGVIVGWILGR
jgi:ElaB/YqjD/DUF883 family membrane-anchored ribosome-binding protein